MFIIVQHITYKYSILFIFPFDYERYTVVLKHKNNLWILRYNQDRVSKSTNSHSKVRARYRKKKKALFDAHLFLDVKIENFHWDISTKVVTTKFLNSLCVNAKLAFQGWSKYRNEDDKAVIMIVILNFMTSQVLLTRRHREK